MSVHLRLLLLPVLLPACPNVDDDDVAADDDTAEPTPDQRERLSPPLGKPDGTMSAGEGAETVFHAQRFRLDTPMRIVGVEAMWRHDDGQDAPAHLAIWPDEGHNFYNYWRDTPLIEWTPEITEEQDREWLTFPLDPPLDIPHPNLIWLGSKLTDPVGQPRLVEDEDCERDPFLEDKMSPEEWDQYRPHVVTWPDRGVDQYGFEQNAWVGFNSPGGDLMVRLVIERYDVVAPEDTWFTDVTAELGTGLAGSGSVSWADCDGDGWEDVWNGRLWRNRGDGTFEDVHDASGIVTGGAAAWGDWDNDGAVDLFLASDVDSIYRGLGDCTFEDHTATAGIVDTQLFDVGNGMEMLPAPTPSATFLDYDGDGLLDLYQANFLSFSTYDATYDYLWHNEGDGTFRDVSEELGLISQEGGGLSGRTVVAGDWDDDGDPDMYVGNYALDRNLGWRNDDWGQGFTNIARNTSFEGDADGGFGNPSFGHTIGCAMGDLDNDLDLDIFAANLAHPRFIAWSDPSHLFRNQLQELGEVAFTDVRADSGLLYQETDSSPILLDYDNDGLLDLFYTAVYPARPSYLYHNEGGLQFRLQSYPAGTWIWGGWGVAGADYDNDGDVDIYGGRFYRNDMEATGQSISVKVTGNGTGQTNRSGLGTKIWVTAGTLELRRDVQGSVGTGSADSFVQTIGIGDATQAEVRVEFPATGVVVDVGTVEAGRRIVVGEDGSVEDL
jgi:hypothetical protein